MLSFYINAVRYGYMEIDQVPEIYRAQVEEALSN